MIKRLPVMVRFVLVIPLVVSVVCQSQIEIHGGHRAKCARPPSIRPLFSAYTGRGSTVSKIKHERTPPKCGISKDDVTRKILGRGIELTFKEGAITVGRPTKRSSDREALENNARRDAAANGNEGLEFEGNFRGKPRSSIDFIASPSRAPEITFSVEYSVGRSSHLFSL